MAKYHLARPEAIPWTGCVSYTGYDAYGNSKGETRGRIRNKYNSKLGVRKTEERKVGIR